MSRTRILLLDADGRAGLASLQTLGSAGHEMHVGVRAHGTSTESSRWCHAIYLQPSSTNMADALKWLAKLDEQFQFTLIIPATEASLRWIRMLPENDPLRKKTCTPSNHAIDVALNKEKTYAAAQQLGLPIAGSRLLSFDENIPEATHFPLVLKPVQSKVMIGQQLVSMAVAVVRNSQEREIALSNRLPFTKVQEQEWIPGRGIGVEVLYQHGKMAMYFVHERLHEWPLTGGASTLRRAAEDDAELVQLSKRLLDSLNWHGVAMVEWRRSREGRLILVEINPRLWGSLPLTISAGVDVPRGLLLMAEDVTLPPHQPWRVGVTARCMREDIRWCLANARADHHDHLLLTEPVGRSALAWLRVLTGRETWDGWRLNDPKVAMHELVALIRQPVRSVYHNIKRHIVMRPIRQRHAAIVARAIARANSNTANSANSARPVTGVKPIKNVLFLCFGNICRSPFAEVAARAILPSITFASAGFYPKDCRPSPFHIVEGSKHFNVNLSAWSSTRVTASQIAQADLIVLMDVSNLRHLEREFPDAVSRATLLGLFDPNGPVEIDDPYSFAPEQTEAVLRDMRGAIKLMCDWLRRVSVGVGGPTGTDNSADANDALNTVTLARRKRG